MSWYYTLLKYSSTNKIYRNNSILINYQFCYSKNLLFENCEVRNLTYMSEPSEGLEDRFYSIWFSVSNLSHYQLIFRLICKEIYKKKSSQNVDPMPFLGGIGMWVFIDNKLSIYFETDNNLLQEYFNASICIAS